MPHKQKCDENLEKASEGKRKREQETDYREREKEGEGGSNTLESFKTVLRGSMEGEGATERV
jgi:hypothetical protein